MGNAFVHVELHTSDRGKAKAFYGELFDWKLEDVPMSPGFVYTTISPGKGTGGGITDAEPAGTPSSWLAYVEVDDVAGATAKAKSLGATVRTEATEIPGIGTFSVIVDPTGAPLALWKPHPRSS